jgi:hypothetical protein
MSGVLQRMAKRALGRLPTVQPLIRSIYAAERINPKPFPLDALPGKEMVEKTAAAPAVPTRAPARENQAQGAASQRPRAALASRLDEVAAHPERRGRPAMSQAVPQAPERPGAEAPIPPVIPLASPPETTEAPADSEPFVEIALTAPVVPMRQDEAKSIAEEYTPAAEPSPQPTGISQAVIQPLQPRRMHVMRDEAAEPEEQKTEINISIGSIELRAAPAEPRPAPPAPFRPRVSLQDFLNRDTGARR